MAGAYVAWSSPKSWAWVLLALVVLGAGWWAWPRSGAEARPRTDQSASRTEPSPVEFRSIPAQTQPAAPDEARTSDEEIALRAQVSDLQGQLAAAKAQAESYRQALGASGAQIANLAADNERMRTAIESVVGASAVPSSTIARKSDVRHLGEPSLTPIGSDWLVSGTWYNVGSAEASGSTEVQLLVDGRPYGSPQVIPMNPIPPGSTSRYQVRIGAGSLESQGHVVLASARWR